VGAFDDGGVVDEGVLEVPEHAVTVTSVVAASMARAMRPGRMPMGFLLLR
jgi:hypothetical protein